MRHPFVLKELEEKRREEKKKRRIEWKENE